jgi:cell fate (sporulation/competence/biofilm development) regulator YlbF (YheA/YmcA/DUF963 family)
MLKDSREYKRFQEASRALEADSELKGMLDLHAEKEAKVAEKMREGKPVEVSEKRELKEEEEEIRSHPIYSEFLEAERGYLTLMKRVNEAMNEAEV